MKDKILREFTIRKIVIIDFYRETRSIPLIRNVCLRVYSDEKDNLYHPWKWEVIIEDDKKNHFIVQLNPYNGEILVKERVTKLHLKNIMEEKDRRFIECWRRALTNK